MRWGPPARMVVLALGGLLAIAFIGVLAWFLTTQRPSPEARHFETLHHNRVPPPEADNAFFDVFGFAAPDDADAHAHGVARVAWLNRSLGNAGNAGLDPAADDPDDQWQTSLVRRLGESCREGSARSCAKAFVAAGADRRLDRRAELQLARYERMLGRAHWFEAMPFTVDDPLPAYGQVLAAQRLRMVRLRQAAADGDSDALRNALENDLAFWRGVQRSSDLLITKMVAIAAIRNHFIYGNLILRELPAEKVMQTVPASWRRALADDERSMWRVMAGEFLFTKSAMNQALVEDDPGSEREISDEITERIFGGILRKVAPPRMLNSHARLLSRLCAAFEVPLDRYLQARNVFIAESGSDQADSYAMYALRVGSIEGMRRAALLVAELRSRGVVAHDVRAQLGRAELRRPFDGEPFTWNAAEQAVQHEGPEKKRRAIALHY